MLTLRNVTKRYGKTLVLDRISMEFQNGVYGLLAPNGAGKTTLMKLLATLSFPTAGEILYEGVDILKLDAAYRDKIGYLPQEFGYYRDQSPKQYLRYLAALKGLEKHAADRRIAELLETVALSDVTDKKMRKFSGGMLQRVGIAQALLNDPKILMLDEPTSGLDPKERVRFRNILSALSRERIVLFSTHIVSDVESIANRILFLKDHQILFDDTLANICATLDRKIYEREIAEERFEAFTRSHTVLSQRQEGANIVLRYLGGEEGEPDARAVTPNLEDVFLYTYGDSAT